MANSFFDNPVGSLQDALKTQPLTRFLLDDSAPLSAPLTKTRTTHTFSLHASLQGNTPQLIGALQTVDFAQDREIDEEYEIDANGVGMPVDMVPQRLSSRTITATRFDLFLNLFEEAFAENNNEFLTLQDQFAPLTMREIWRDPASGALLATATRAYVYTGVYIKSFGRHIGATDDLIVRTNAVFTWKERFRAL